MGDDALNMMKTIQPGEGDSLGRIDQYELLRELGGGGFGTVYLARDTVVGIEVAVKGLPPLVRSNHEELENIRSNFALVSRLTHTNIAKALVLHPAKEVSYSSEDVGQKLRVFPGDTLMVMEYAPGVTLSQWRKHFPGRKVPLETALDVVRQMACALDYAHGQRIVHRDIKPANIMVETRQGGGIVVRILDFGLAAEIRSSLGRVSQEVHDTSGTRPYMAPEQWLGERQGAATDQYSLAVLLYELITGEVPFSSVFYTGDPVVMMGVVTRKPFTPPSSLPKSVRIALKRALAKNPRERFPTCVDFVDALSKGRGGTFRTFMQLAFLAFLAALVCGAWFYKWQQRERAKEEERRTALETTKRLGDEAKRIAAMEDMRRAEDARRVKEEDAERIAAEKAKRIAAEEAKRVAAEEAKRVAMEQAERRAVEAAERLAMEAAKVTEEKRKRIEAENARMAKENARMAKEDKSPPSMVVVATLDGHEVSGAKMKKMNGTVALPYTWEGTLSKGRSFGPYAVTYSKDGCDYAGEFSVTVDWKGRKKVAVELRRMKPGDGMGGVRSAPKGIGSWAF